MNVVRTDASTYEWHIITCEYPPQIGGVSDCTATFAALLGADAPTHVWCPRIDTPALAPPAGVEVHRELGDFSVRDLRRVGRLLDQRSAARRLFVQWVPHGYGHRSVNLPMACWLLMRAWWHRDDLQVLVHEPCAPLSLRPGLLAAALVHRLMLVLVCLGASTVWESTPSWGPIIRPYLLGRIRPQWLPIPAATAAVSSPPRALASDDSPLVVGHFGTFSPSVAPILESALEVVLERSSAHVRLIGRGSERFMSELLRHRPECAPRVHAAGVVPLSSLAGEFAACDVMLQPYPDGISARRTSSLALLRAGLPVVTNEGVLCETFWQQEDAVELLHEASGGAIGEATVRLLADPDRRAVLARNAESMYARYFDTSHITSALVRRTPHTPWAS